MGKCEVPTAKTGEKHAECANSVALDALKVNTSGTGTRMIWVMPCVDAMCARLPTSSNLTSQLKASMTSVKFQQPKTGEKHAECANSVALDALKVNASGTGTRMIWVMPCVDAMC